MQKQYRRQLHRLWNIGSRVNLLLLADKISQNKVFIVFDVNIIPDMPSYKSLSNILPEHPERDAFFVVRSIYHGKRQAGPPR